MKESQFLKFLMLSGLSLMFAVALIAIAAITGDRKGYRDQVIAEVAQGVGRDQTVLGPMLVVPYTTSVTRDGKVATQGSEQVLLPDSLIVTSTVAVEPRKRGIHRVQVYRSSHRLVAVFHLPANLGIDESAGERADGLPRWTFGVSDSRGLHRPPRARVDGVEVALSPGSRVDWVPLGFSGDAVFAGGTPPSRVVLEADIDLLGTSRLGVVPVGSFSRIELTGNWPHPSFTGSFLPDERRVDAKGFRAVWELSRFAADIEDAIAGWKSQNQNRHGRAAALDVGVTFIEPVDVYQKSERATKYGMLFVILTFASIFVFEVMKRMRVHPFQYGLVAAGQALFFLLLLSLAEHVPFALAYLVASAACVALLTYYVTSVLGGTTRGLGFGALLAMLYGLLYVILESKDYALLLGTLLLFVVLTAIVVTTRRLDWYQVTETPKT